MSEITATSAVLIAPGNLQALDIPVPEVPGDSVPVEMRACGICGSDIRYLHGENPWSQHTLGRNLPSPPNMVLGHEVSGIADFGEKKLRIAVLAYKGCGTCEDCTSGNEHLCERTEHFGHSAGWGRMEYYPGGMAERFTIWRDWAYEIPESISFEDGVFLDGLAVALHALETGGMEPGKSVGIIGLGPVGILAGMAASALGASRVCGCDVDRTAVHLAEASGIRPAVAGEAGALADVLDGDNRMRVDVIIDTVGTGDSISDGLRMLAKRGTHSLLAVHEEPASFAPISLNGERKLTTSANNRYRDFPAAIDLLASGRVRVNHLITHRFPLSEVREAFRVMEHKERERAFKVVIVPDAS
jgi:2-desacetyl-2-hydroxyethyl bacteriochlorophyllide A dehydrogenase